MPYSGSDDPNIPDNVPEADKAQWVEVWNSTYNACIEDGGEVEECESAAFVAANGVIKNTVQTIGEAFDQFRRVIMRFLSPSENIERALSLPNLYDQLWRQIMDEFEPKFEAWIWLNDVYLEEGEMFAVMAIEGKLYRSNITMDGDVATMDEPTEVSITFVDTGEQRMSIRRQDDGTVRWFLITGTSVINRMGEIDSMEFFDNMISRVEESDVYPYLDFFHLGKEFEMGEADWLARDGVALLASGLFNDTNTAEAMIRAYEEDPEYWGCSNEFYPIGATELWDVGDGITIPVYNDGKYRAITILPENDACCLLTAVRANSEKELVMDQRTEDALKKLAGDDEELAEEFIGRVDGVNRAVEEEDLVHRETEAEATAETTGEEAAEEVETEEETTDEVEETEEEISEESEPVEDEELVLDESAIVAIVQAVAESEIFTTFMSTVNDSIATLRESVTLLETSLNEARAAHISETKKLKAQIADLEKTEEQKKAEFIADMPAASPRKVTFRPKVGRSGNGDETGEEESMQEIAESTLSKFDE